MDDAAVTTRGGFPGGVASVPVQPVPHATPSGTPVLELRVRDQPPVVSIAAIVRTELSRLTPTPYAPDIEGPTKT